MSTNFLAKFSAKSHYIATYPTLHVVDLADLIAFKLTFTKETTGVTIK